MLNDLRHATRGIVRDPGLALIAVLALALGIGLTAGMFSIVYGALWRGMPFERADRLITVMRVDVARGSGRLPVRTRELAEYRARARSFEGLAGWYDATVNVSGTERPVRADGAYVAANAFGLVRVRPMLGRDFSAADEAPGAPPVAILAYTLWRDRYHADAGMVGRTIRANGVPTTVVGVMPAGFRFPDDNELWLPLRDDPLRVGWDAGPMLEVFGRLKDGIPLAQANAEIAGIQRRIALEHPTEEKGLAARVAPILEDYMGPSERHLLFTMLGAVILVLLIGCFNVANLLLSRTLVRTREIGIRAALGAGRTRIATQFLTEALVLALAGALLGTGIAWAGVRAFRAAIAGTNPPFYLDFRLDAVPLLFTLALAVASAVLAGALPALRAGRADVAGVLKDESRGGSSLRLGRLTRGLVMLEVALSCGLLVGAGLAVKSVARLRTLDLGMPADHIFDARLTLPASTYPDDAARTAFWDALVPRLRAIPGVRDASLATAAPGLGAGYDAITVEGHAYAREGDHPVVHSVTVSPGFLRTLALRPLAGRSFAEGDVAAALPVALVNRSLARRQFPDGAVGRRIRLGPGAADSVWRTIVGVVPDAYANQAGAPNNAPDAIYLPLAQQPAEGAHILLRTAGSPTSMTGAVRDAVNGLDPDLPIYRVDALDHAVHARLWFVRVFGAMLVLFGGAALFLATVGLYAVMAFSVRRRTREMGIRMALGARAEDLLRLVLRQGMTQAAIGLALGLLLALGLSRLLAIVLFGVNPRDPAVFAAIALVLAGTAALACVIPARRAARVAPNTALKLE